jgi:tetratricopeptide (TPR) repeat protein
MKTLLPFGLLILVGCATHPDVRSVEPQVSGVAMTPAAESSLYLGVVEGLIQQRRYQAAIAFLAKYQKNQKQTPRFFKLVGDALSGARRYDEAMAAYRHLLKSAYSAQAYNGIGRALSAKGKWAEAAENFRSAAMIDPTNARYLNNCGYAQLKQNFQGVSLAPVVGALERAHELDPDSGTIRNNLVLALTISGDHAQLEALLGAIADSDKRKQVAEFAGHWAPTWSNDTGTWEGVP